MGFLSVLLGIEYFWILTSSIWLTYKCAKSGFKSALNIILSILILSLTLSATIGWARSGEFERILSSIYSLGILVGGGYFGTIALRYFSTRLARSGKQANFRHNAIEVLGRLSSRIILFCFLLLSIGVVYFFATKAPSLSFPTIFHGFADSRTEMLRYLSNTRIYRQDWGFESFASPRFVYLARWATAGSIIVALSGNFASMYYWVTGKRFLFFIFEILTIVLLLSTLTRSTILGFSIGSLVLYILLIRNINKRIAAIFLAVLSILFFLFLSQYLTNYIFGFRSYSTEDRLSLYIMAFKQFSEMEPFFGLGFKPKDLSIAEYAIGSHSMLISFLVRGGLIAASLAAIAFWILPARMLLSLALSRDRFQISVWPFFARGLLMLWLWTLVQEIDTSMLTFSCIYIFLLSLDLTSRKSP